MTHSAATSDRRHRQDDEHYGPRTDCNRTSVAGGERPQDALRAVAESGRPTTDLAGWMGASSPGGLLASSGWLVHRQLAHSGAGHQRARHGDPDPCATGWGDHPLRSGGQFASWAFTPARQGLRSGALNGLGRDCYDNLMIEALWSRMQVELWNRRRWRTRVELANAIFEYLEIFHYRQRRHSSLGC
jgi:hypothetical protein